MIALIPINLVFFQFLGGLPLYIVNELHYTEATFGILMSINTIMIVLVEVPLNNAMSNWDDRKSLALGPLLGAVVLDKLNSTILWGGAFVLALISTTMFVMMTKKTEK